MAPNGGHNGPDGHVTPGQEMSEAEQLFGSQLHLEKILLAPRERVFAAFVDAEQPPLVGPDGIYGSEP
jgi:hypothetical protein